jgi:peptide/nickel transport system substrate-binding protein
LQRAGYGGERVVIINPVDFPTIAPLGDVTYDLLKKLGMNVEMVAADSGTVTQRRTSKEPIDKGGWSILHTWARANVVGTPVEHQFIRGLGMAGWPGWFADEQIEQRTREWLLASSQAERDRLAEAVQRRAFETVPMIPLGQFQIRTAHNKNLAGRIEANGALFWNIRRV